VSFARRENPLESARERFVVQRVEMILDVDVYMYRLIFAKKMMMMKKKKKKKKKIIITIRRRRRTCHTPSVSPRFSQQKNL